MAGDLESLFESMLLSDSIGLFFDADKELEEMMAGAVTTATTAVSLRAQQEALTARHRKEKFLMFARVLMKYLEQKDPGMHERAKAVVQECVEKNKNKEAGYESVTASMQTRLRATVGDAYWKRAESYLNHFLRQKKAKVEEAKRQQQKQLQEKQERERAAARQKIEQIEKEAAEAKGNKQSKQQKVEEAKEQRARQQQEKFLMFTRVLMRYLELKDPSMHARAKAVIWKCTEKNKNKEAGYESLTGSMKSRLRETVGNEYWKRAKMYSNRNLRQKKER